MSQQNPYPPDLNYQQPPPRLSGMALTSMILGILAFPMLCIFGLGIILGVVALVLGIVGLIQIRNHPERLGGMGFAIAGIVLGGLSGIILLPFLVAILLPSLGKARELSNRSVCAANLRSIGQSLDLYANAYGDAFPVVPYAPYGPSNASTSTATLSAASPTDAAKQLLNGGPQDGSPLAGLWILVLRGDVTPRQLLCKSDLATPASLQSPAGGYYATIPADNQFSYSVAYPYEVGADGTAKVGKWWTSPIDADLPIMSDMAPVNGTGTPRRDVTAPGKSANSGNHQTDGQNVLFGDAHVEFARRPTVGHDNDNIFTVNPAGGPSSGGVQPRPAPIIITGRPGGFDKVYDTVMVPARNLDTGKLW